MQYADFRPERTAWRLSKLFTYAIWDSPQRPLSDQKPQPFPELVSCFRQQAHFLESQRSMQTHRLRIFSTDTRNHRVAAFRLALGDQLSQKRLADTVADAIRPHINRVFDRIAIAFARAKLRRVAKPHDVTLKL